MNADAPVVVIGSGLGGLAAAAVAAARGHRVVVYDKNEWLGGKAAQLTEAGFRFDMGPTILTLPTVLERIFAEAGERLEDRLDLVRLDPQWRCFFGEGESLDLSEDVAVTGAAAEAFSGPSGRGRWLREVHPAVGASARRFRTVLLLARDRRHSRHDEHPREHEPGDVGGTCSPCAWAVRWPA